MIARASRREPGTYGPYRFAPRDIRKLFGESRSFEVVEILDADYQGQLARYPKALFCTIRAA